MQPHEMAAGRLATRSHNIDVLESLWTEADVAGEAAMVEEHQYAAAAPSDDPRRIRQLRRVLTAVDNACELAADGSSIDFGTVTRGLIMGIATGAAAFGIAWIKTGDRHTSALIAGLSGFAAAVLGTIISVKLKPRRFFNRRLRLLLRDRLLDLGANTEQCQAAVATLRLNESRRGRLLRFVRLALDLP
jgi:hypothetical protein